MISFLDNPNLKLILFGGKGGVGKTTSAASTAIYLAKTRPNDKVLILSTDPAHSLSDSFDQPLEDEVTPLKDFKNLYGLEMNSKKLHEIFLKEHGADLMELTDRATYFDTDQLSNIQAMSYPTSFDFMAIMKLIELLESEEYHPIVIDTAPTGHTLMFLRLVHKIIDQVSVMKKTGAKERYMSSRFHGQYIKSSTDRFLDKLKEDLKKFKWLLTGYETEFVTVTIAEEMSVYETIRFIETLKRYGITSKNIIVNGLNPSSECNFCLSRQTQEEKYLKEIKTTFPAHYIIKIPLFAYEIRGERLTEYANFLTGKAEFKREPLVFDINARLTKDYNPPTTQTPSPVSPAKMLTSLERRGLKCIVFCGKGGVGKTTSAAGTAVYLANARPDKKILIFSTDPAHSLSDSFGYSIGEGYSIGDKITLIKDFKNLWGLEIDPEKKFDEFKEEYERKIREAFEKASAPKSGQIAGIGFQTVTTCPFDEQSMHDLASLAPLGLDEFMALADTIAKFANEYDLIIIDTAPTGHLVRLLQTPEMVLKWFTNTIKGVQTYQGVIEVFEPIKHLLDARKEVLLAHKYFMDHKKTEFVAVAIAEMMGIAETERLLIDLRNLRASYQNAIVNKVIPASVCSFCAAKRKEQLGYLESLQEKFANYSFTEVPLFPHEIRGQESLLNFAKYLYGKLPSVIEHETTSSPKTF